MTDLETLEILFNFQDLNKSVKLAATTGDQIKQTEAVDSFISSQMKNLYVK